MITRCLRKAIRGLCFLIAVFPVIPMSWSESYYDAYALSADKGSTSLSLSLFLSPLFFFMTHFLTNRQAMLQIGILLIKLVEIVTKKSTMKETSVVIPLRDEQQETRCVNFLNTHLVSSIECKQNMEYVNDEYKSKDACGYTEKSLAANNDVTLDTFLAHLQKEKQNTAHLTTNTEHYELDQQIKCVNEAIRLRNLNEVGESLL